MKNFFNKFIPRRPLPSRARVNEQLKHQTTALYEMYAGIFGPDKVVLKAVKLDALSLMNSENTGERVLALQKLVFEDPTMEKIPTLQEVPEILVAIEEEIASLMARRSLEDRLEKKINDKMEERHQEYVREIKMQVLKEEENNVENPQTLKKYAMLEVLEQKKLTKSAMEITRPETLGEIVGQERAVEALRSKLASPYPQHLILYGPPGVGKTTAARLVLEAAKSLKFTPFAQEAPFIEVDGTTLRWDSRGMTNPLLGSVHDPIYQGARRDLAETGVPEPKPGLATDAHGGILFIDEIGEMDAMLQNKLLKVLEDKRVSFESAYYDPSDPNVPKYIKKLFEDGAPADFILIGATTRDASEINPAIRSRCAEIYFEPLTPKHIEEIVYNAAVKLGVALESDVAALISEYTIEGRKAVNILSDAFGIALYRSSDHEKVVITHDDVYKVVQVSRLTPFVNLKAAKIGEVGKVFGLGVAGYLGSVLEIEAVSFAAGEKGKGRLRFNDTAGSMAKDSVFNAAAVVRKITGEDLGNYDVHINIIGGGRIDGPSAGTGILAAIISAITERPIRQDVAVTGEISIQGKVKAVGGVFEKAYGAKQAGITTMIIPKENEKDIPQGHLGLEICPVDNVEEALAILLSDTEQKSA
ncbi:Lon family ATP-dependent protease [Pelosinus fermentans]|nr:Lon family ATP-dependent protease [Pelosinus fermentans]